MCNVLHNVCVCMKTKTQHENELTICSVYHSARSKHFLELSRELTESLNDRRDWSWVVMDNTPADYAEERLDSSKFRVVRGIPMTECVKTLALWQLGMRTSYHHVSAINNTLPHITTRFALILDNDFFIVRKNWIRVILQHMKNKELAFFGPPWHPRWIKKVRYFPAHHALFIDTSRVSLSHLNFLPQYTTPKSLSSTHLFSSPRLPSFLAHLRKKIDGRYGIGTALDTSYDLYKNYYKPPTIRSEYVVPSFRPYEKYWFPMTVIRKLIDRITPDRFSYVPRRGSYTTEIFKDGGHFSARGEGWEEFFWQNIPFGFHMRSTPDVEKRDWDKEVRALEIGVEHFKEHPAT